MDSAVLAYNSTNRRFFAGKKVLPVQKVIANPSCCIPLPTNPALVRTKERLFSFADFMPLYIV
ncbi:hypothetical protein BT93_L2109 [Corymbia citriodora subsp. variegata]|uniref:Uncharacterized protein n=1 Tax=Corymbia citriodora subsp. variegata TaxID=360336 RepID=A0A8T0CKY0_CORYI|nr:hypothetical protein BT93_L2109 [Corymbia citriodora subsp. variegata]